MKKKQRKVIATLMTLSMACGIASMNVNAADEGEVSKEALNYHVAVNGNDEDDGSAAKPFRTIERAQQEVRKQNDDMEQDIRVVIHEGTYFMDRTLEFNSEDSATNGYRISYESAPGEEVLISGGTQLDGVWEDVGDGIYKTNVGDMRFRQLYVNGKKAYRATTRDVTTDGRADSNYYRAYWQRDKDRYKLKVNKSDFDLSVLSKEALNQVEAIIIQHWSESYVRLDEITSSDENINLVSIKEQEHDILSKRGYSKLREGDPYYLENALEFVDQGGEWFLDNTDGNLYYKAKEGEDIQNVTMTVPMTETLWSIEGTYDAPVENMEVHGLDFAYTTWLRPNEYGHICAQAGLYNTKTELPNDQWVERPAAGIEVNATKNFVFERNELYNMGATGIDLYLGTQNSKIVGNSIHDIAGNGIMLAEFSPGEFHIPYQPEDSREICKDDEIANNYITNIATDYLGGCAIAAGHPQGAVIEHNEIHNTPYTAITVGWGWHHEKKTPMEYNMIRYNEIYDVVRLMSDGAAIYTLSYQPESQITENYIHDISYNAPTQPAPVCAIFLDEGSGGLTVKKNVINNLAPGTRRIFRNANSNPVEDNKELLADVIQNAGLEEAYKDIKTGSQVEKPVLESVSSPITAGEEGKITGMHFGVEQGSVHITCAELDYEVTSDQIVAWSDNEIRFIVPIEIKEKEAKVSVENNVGYRSNEMTTEINVAGPLTIVETFDYEEGALPKNDIWASQSEAEVITVDGEKVLQLTSKGKNGKACMNQSVDNYTLIFDTMLKTAGESIGDGIYMQLRDNMRLEWIKHDTEPQFSFSKNGVRMDGLDLAPITEQWHTVKLEVNGEDLRAKIWKRGSEEPAEWMIEAKQAGTSVPVSIEYYHTVNGQILFDNISLNELQEPEEDNKGKNQNIDFEKYEEGELADTEIFEAVDGANVVVEDGNKLAKLSGKGSNSIITLKGEYQNYDLQMDLRFDSELNQNQSEGLYFLLKTMGGNNFIRVEYLPTWKNVFSIKNGPSSILDTTNDIQTEYGAWYTMKVSVKGNEYLIKVWKKGEEEPEEWTLKVKDGSFPMGKISIEYYAESADLSVDNIEISNVDFSVIESTETVTGIESVEDKVVWKGNSAYSFGLPEYLKLELDGQASDKVARVEWQYQNYKPKQTGEQVVEGMLKTNYDVKNPDNIKAQVKIITIDNAELKELVSKAEAKVKNAYTEESYQALETALNEATALLAGEPISVDNVTAKTEALRQAVDSLVLSESMETLKKLLEDSQSLLDSTKDILYENGGKAYDGYYAKAEYDELSSVKENVGAIYDELLKNKDLSEDEFVAKLNGAITDITEAMESFNTSKITVDKKALEDLIKAAKELNADEYTEDSYEALQGEVAKAEDLLNGKVTQKMVDDQLTALETAFGNLVQKVDKTALEEALKKADALDLKKYQDGKEKDRFVKALRQAQKMLDNEKATQEDVNATILELEEAQKNLKLKEDSNKPTDPENSDKPDNNGGNSGNGNHTGNNSDKAVQTGDSNSVVGYTVMTLIAAVAMLLVLKKKNFKKM